MAVQWAAPSNSMEFENGSRFFFVCCSKKTILCEEVVAANLPLLEEEIVRTSAPTL